MRRFSSSPEVNLQRRHFLTAAAAMGFGMVHDALCAERNPAVQVADKATNLKITGLKTFWVNPCLFVRIETNQSIIGWGDIKAVDPRVARVLVESLYELLDGENPTRIEYLWQKLFRAHRNIRGGAFMIHTIAGIDQALWDITGKLYGIPVYRLLGGPCRDKIRVYHTPKAIKVPPPMVFEQSSAPAEIEKIVSAIKAAREKVGPDGAVMFDAHSALPPATLIQFASAVEPFNILFLEEPAVPGNIEVFKRIKAAVRIPLAAGERDRTIWGVLPYLQERCLDVLQPDCCHTGGISQMKKIAALAETFQVSLAPHCTASNLGIAASLHAIAATPLFLIHEFYPDNHGFNPAVRDAAGKMQPVARIEWNVDKDGYVNLPQGPGLGVDMDEKLIIEADSKPHTYKWAGKKLQDGSIADY
jgi:galactonate dehydratase